MIERIHWTWEYGVRRADGIVVTSAQEEYPWRTMRQAMEYADQLNRMAVQIGSPDRVATVIKRKRWMKTVKWQEGWQKS